MEKKVIIIGGGLGGLSAAVCLAVEGYSVTVYEQGSQVGGKLNKQTGKGYSFDTGPSELTMPWVLEQLFTRAGKKMDDYFSLIRIQPQWKAFFSDETTFELTSDLPLLFQQLKEQFDTDATALLQYLQHCSKMYELTQKSYYKKSLTGSEEMRKMHNMKEWMSLSSMKSVHQKTSQYIQSPHLKQLFDYLSISIGSSPHQAPVFLSLMTHSLLGMGSFYAKGGMYTIAEGIERLLQELQVKVHTNIKVSAIQYDDQERVKGILLQDGTTIPADIVICNRDPVTAYHSLLSNHPKVESAIRDLNKYPPGLSGMVLLLGVKGTYDHLQHRNIFFSANPQEEYEQLFKEGKPATDPTISVHLSCKSDPGQAPKKKSNMVVLTHVPPLKPGESWEPYRRQYRDRIIEKLEQRGITGLEKNIEIETQFIPDDFHHLYGANGGSLYGVAADRKKNNGFKIPCRSTLLQNLYFVGGSIHPGGSIPMASLSGQLAADLIIKDHAIIPVPTE